jgi:hypothetical protein
MKSLSVLATRTLFASALLIPFTSQAAQIPSFKATFDIWVLGFKIGQAHQEMNCQNGDCHLSSEAIPPAWAKAFINESAIEKIQLKQSDEDFKWLEYKKFLTREYDDRTEKKTYTLIRREDLDKVEYVEDKKFWPNQKQIYDVISMAYGIQYQVINQRPIDNIYLQDDKIQQKITFSTINESDEIDLPFEEAVQTKLFAFHNGKIEAELWLLPELNYFPARIVILNKDEDRKIELELNHKPTFK